MEIGFRQANTAGAGNTSPQVGSADSISFALSFIQSHQILRQGAKELCALVGQGFIKPGELFCATGFLVFCCLQSLLCGGEFLTDSLQYRGGALQVVHDGELDVFKV